MKFSFRHLAAAFLLLTLTCILPAATMAAAPEAPAPLHRLELGDQIRVDVFDNPDLETTTYVGDDGSIRMPLIGNVSVRGHSPAEAADKIEAALRDGQYLLDPHVTVTLVESFIAQVTVVGEVANAGRYDIGPNSTVLDVIAMAGGITEKGSDTAYILRADASGSLQRTPVRLDMGQIVSSGNDGAAALQVLQGGDSVVVPKATFTITGEVQTPGEYRLESGMLLFQAIARAGGVTPLGSASRVQIRRRGPDGKFTDIRGKRDTPIQADDVIHVKERLF